MKKFWLLPLLVVPYQSIHEEVKTRTPTVYRHNLYGQFLVEDREGKSTKTGRSAPVQIVNPRPGGDETTGQPSPDERKRTKSVIIYGCCRTGPARFDDRVSKFNANRD
jgi:hypothetical protein